VAGGLAVLDGVRALGAAAARLEWPNDVVVRGAKLAGILVETRGLDLAHPVYVIGVGLNVAQRNFPEELVAERQVTSLALEGVRVAVTQAEAAVVPRLVARLTEVGEDPERLERDYLAAAGLGGEVAATTAQGVVRGVLVALNLTEGVVLEVEGERRCLALELLRGLAPTGG